MNHAVHRDLAGAADVNDTGFAALEEEPSAQVRGIRQEQGRLGGHDAGGHGAVGFPPGELDAAELKKLGEQVLGAELGGVEAGGLGGGVGKDFFHGKSEILGGRTILSTKGAEGAEMFNKLCVLRAWAGDPRRGFPICRLSESRGWGRRELRPNRQPSNLRRRERRSSPAGRRRRRRGPWGGGRSRWA